MSESTPHSPIISKDNHTVKYLRSLSDPKRRKKEKAFCIEGIKMVEEALRDDLGVRLVAASPTLFQRHGKGILKLAENRSIGVIWISEKVLDNLSESKTPQPVMGVVGMKQHGEDDLIAAPSGLIVVVHQLQDPGNLGTIIRTAEAVAASGVAITANTVDPFNAKAVRASMGSILRLPVAHVRDAAAFVGKCKTNGFQAVATSLTGDKVHFGVDLTKPTVLVFGQEGSGLTNEIMESIDIRIRIPMADTIDSLNVATAASVILYEAMRQRMHAG